MVSIKRIAYAYNSNLEGASPYFFDAFVSEDGETLVDVHQQFKTLEEFHEAIGAVIPILESKNENRQEQAQDERWDSENLQIREGAG